MPILIFLFGTDDVDGWTFASVILLLLFLTLMISNFVLHSFSLAADRLGTNYARLLDEKEQRKQDVNAVLLRNFALDDNYKFDVPKGVLGECVYLGDFLFGAESDKTIERYLYDAAQGPGSFLRLESESKHGIHISTWRHHDVSMDWRTVFDRALLRSHKVFVLPPLDFKSSLCDEIDHVVKTGNLEKAVFVMLPNGKGYMPRNGSIAKIDARECWKKFQTWMSERHKLELPNFTAIGALCVYDAGAFRRVSWLEGKIWFSRASLQKVLYSKHSEDKTWRLCFSFSKDLLIAFPLFQLFAWLCFLFFAAVTIEITVPELSQGDDEDRFSEYMSLPIFSTLEFILFFAVAYDFLRICTRKYFSGNLANLLTIFALVAFAPLGLFVAFESLISQIVFVWLAVFYVLSFSAFCSALVVSRRK